MRVIADSVLRSNVERSLNMGNQGECRLPRSRRVRPRLAAVVMVASVLLAGAACSRPGRPTNPTTTRPTTPPSTAPGRPTTTVSPSGGGGAPPTGTVRVFWLKPSDVAYDAAYPNGIASVMREVQRYYGQELGKTFRLNDTVVEVVDGDHVRSWYENTPNGGEKYWWAVFNMQQELVRKTGVRDGDPRWVGVGEISAEGDGAGGGGGNGWVILSGHDADGAAGRNGPMNRWYGGMAHEIGHAFGLPDATHDDGTPMSGDFYNYPDTHFSADQKQKILSGPYGTFFH